MTLPRVVDQTLNPLSETLMAKLITLAALTELLAATNGSQFVSFVAKTDAKAKKTGNPFGKVWKRAKIVGIVNFNYTNSVNNQRAREGTDADFTAKARQWGTKLVGVPFVVHTPKGMTEQCVYLEVKVESATIVGYEDDNGNPLTAEQVKPFLPADKSEAIAEAQGVEKAIHYTNYNVVGMEQFAIGGERYDVMLNSVAAFAATAMPPQSVVQ